ncbi:channel protein (hemolysin III family) [Streptohalobacillus salinus]|uniref:Channel protein (Hemolysin III family) n=1 Tax=Streptohalobacillus salinus TaxID=621096 RepID=A0A2V3WDG9_9BACI|nr:hemolysin III family protein [Streptohalobacillus salinus]PXW92956.1 channel protein (hemolysin III family) [Streptohalobacillus salinus]
MNKVNRFSFGEELANAITHGVGLLFSIAALVLLIAFSSIYGSWIHVVSFTIFGVTMVFLYTSSTLLHSLPLGRGKNVFEILDHSSIYFFIAGTYTPFLLIAVRGTFGIQLFITIWTIALFGSIFKIFFVKRFVVVSTLIYIFMGWMIVFTWSDLTAVIPTPGIMMLAIGGLLYTLGAVFYVFRWFKFHHMVWHIFVLAATILHFFVVLLYLLPISVN